MPDDARSATDWIAAFAARLDLEPPSPADVEVLLDRTSC
jgi:hypothetical protein